MKLSIAFVAVALLSIASASFVTHSSAVKYADQDTLQKQEDIFALLRFVHEPEYNQQLVSYKNYNIEKNIASYTNIPALKVIYLVIVLLNVTQLIKIIN